MLLHSAPSTANSVKGADPTFQQLKALAEEQEELHQRFNELHRELGPQAMPVFQDIMSQQALARSQPDSTSGSRRMSPVQVHFSAADVIQDSEQLELTSLLASPIADAHDSASVEQGLTPPLPGSGPVVSTPVRPNVGRGTSASTATKDSRRSELASAQSSAVAAPPQIPDADALENPTNVSIPSPSDSAEKSTLEGGRRKRKSKAAKQLFGQASNSSSTTTATASTSSASAGLPPTTNSTHTPTNTDSNDNTNPNNNSNNHHSQQLDLSKDHGSSLPGSSQNATVMGSSVHNVSGPLSRTAGDASATTAEESHGRTADFVTPSTTPFATPGTNVNNTSLSKSEAGAKSGTASLNASLTSDSFFQRNLNTSAGSYRATSPTLRHMNDIFENTEAFYLLALNRLDQALPYMVEITGISRLALLDEDTAQEMDRYDLRQLVRTAVSHRNPQRPVLELQFVYSTGDERLLRLTYTVGDSEAEESFKRLQTILGPVAATNQRLRANENIVPRTKCLNCKHELDAQERQALVDSRRQCPVCGSGDVYDFNANQAADRAQPVVIPGVVSAAGSNTAALAAAAAAASALDTSVASALVRSPFGSPASRAADVVEKARVAAAAAVSAAHGGAGGTDLTGDGGVSTASVAGTPGRRAPLTPRKSGLEYSFDDHDLNTTMSSFKSALDVSRREVGLFPKLEFLLGERKNWRMFHFGSKRYLRYYFFPSCRRHCPSFASRDSWTLALVWKLWLVISSKFRPTWNCSILWTCNCRWRQVRGIHWLAPKLTAKLVIRFNSMLPFLLSLISLLLPLPKLSTRPVLCGGQSRKDRECFGRLVCGHQSKEKHCQWRPG